MVLKYGKDSREYEMTGGVRKSDRIRKATSSYYKTICQYLMSLVVLHT
ncbi:MULTISPECIES: hypothetical protein [unclassified Nostoc]|nr:hypothetical protein [Nostoc sp. ChiQUE02]MDZ8235061.1 hypothetical protein [Nostoc sp. ChiQUE02]